MVLDRGLEIGSRGSNGAIRYHVVSHTPGRAVTFRFDPGMPMQGTHGLTSDPEPGSDGLVRWTHVADLESLTRFARYVIVPLHDAVMEDLLDSAEAHLSGRPLPRRRRPPGLEALHVLAQRATPSTLGRRR